MIAGIGTDIVEVIRMEQALERHGERFSARVLTPAEQLEMSAVAAPERFLAKRFAVKEAAAKALGTGFAQGISWQDFAVIHNELGAPALTLAGAALKLAEQKAVTRVHVSISDERHYAVAYVLLESD